MKTVFIFGIAVLLLPMWACNNSKDNLTATSQETTISAPAVVKFVPPAIPTAESFAEARSQGVSLEVIDNIYAPAFDMKDTNKAAFGGRMKEVEEAYTQMETDAAHYLQKNDSLKHKEIGYFNKVYFKANGTIDYYLYNVRLGFLSQQEEALFKRLLNEFIKTHKFPMTAKVPFVQCSPILIEPKQ